MEKQQLRPGAAAARLGVSVPTLWRYCRVNPAFPRPRKLSARVTVFDAGELDAFAAGAAVLRGPAAAPLKMPEAFANRKVSTKVVA